MSGIVEAMRAWLPVPTYSFVGGPFDGQKRTVNLIETAGGMIAPEVWNIAELPELKISADPVAVCDTAVTVHRYRFVSQDRFRNSGHYEYLAPPHSPQ